MEASRLHFDLESLVTLTVQLLDAARSGNPMLLEQTASQRDSIVNRLKNFNDLPAQLNETTRKKMMDCIGMVQKLDREVAELIRIQHSKALNDLGFLEKLKRELIQTGAVGSKGQRLETHG